MRACYRKVCPIGRLTTKLSMDEVPNKHYSLTNQVMFLNQNAIKRLKPPFSYDRY